MTAINRDNSLLTNTSSLAKRNSFDTKMTANQQTLSSAGSANLATGANASAGTTKNAALPPTLKKKTLNTPSNAGAVASVGSNSNF
jgi:hypothetical protein